MTRWHMRSLHSTEPQMKQFNTVYFRSQGVSQSCKHAQTRFLTVLPCPLPPARPWRTPSWQQHPRVIVLPVRLLCHSDVQKVNCDGECWNYLSEVMLNIHTQVFVFQYAICTFWKSSHSYVPLMCGFIAYEWRVTPKEALKAGEVMFKTLILILCFWWCDLHLTYINK